MDWRKSKKSAVRNFSLEINVPIFFEAVEWVLDTIENDTLYVFRPDDPKAMWEFINEAGETIVNKRATLAVSIREWLCVACQIIEDGRPQRPNVFGYYQYNAFDVIFQEFADWSPGPAAFIGRIGLLNCCFPQNNSDTEFDAFMFVVAHELVHAFDMMRFLVPAVMDWDRFWRIAVGEGSHCNDMHGAFHEKSLFLDDYNSENELAMIEEFWPSHAKRWFEAFRTQRVNAQGS